VARVPGVVTVPTSAPGWRGGINSHGAGGRPGPGSQGQSSPERQRGVEALEDASGGGEAAPVTDDIDVVALQCQARREKVRGE
jgi:hypothetical protein